ncbi:MAG: hypothetical protein CVU42_01470 [Chloroflexi bacterium HGW-Chloroflexi-4]|jgi:hypothetical protein|nr:MAG: hypothetical protein CVU42_01470 [Chloroflexi bacterium HGW-Chloroflexi-4]
MVTFLFDDSLTMFIYDLTMMENEKSVEPLMVERGGYHSFLLRIWKPKGLIGTRWLFSLENPITHELIGFQNQYKLIKYLTQIIEKKQVD